MDNNGYTALSHAVSGGHIEVVKYLSNLTWDPDNTVKSEATQSAFVLCAMRGHTEVCEYLLDKLQESVKCHIDATDSMTGETGACSMP